MEYISGEILTPDGFKRGYIGFGDGLIVEIGKGSAPKKPICKGLVTPTFVNAHTHIGDSFIRKKNIDLPRDIEELVAPPNGLKHILLKQTSEEEVIEGMKESIDIMINAGTSHFCDFREGGVHGIEMLRKSVKNKSISPIILARPTGLEYVQEEIDLLLKNSDGIGLSSISDWDYSELLKVARHTKGKKKIFAIHASERIREDIDLILDLHPDFLVHMIHATKEDFERVKDCKIPIVVCPRSNNFFGLKPNFMLMKKLGLDILIGTDNGMLNSADILDEIKFILKNSKIFSLEELLYMVTFGARKGLNVDSDILSPNSQANFTVLDKKSLEILYISRY